MKPNPAKRINDKLPRRRAYLPMAVWFVLAFCLSCEEPLEEDGTNPDEKSVGTAQQGILNGYAADEILFGAPYFLIHRMLGDLRIRTSKCSSTLITNRIAISASHCIDTKLYGDIPMNNEYELRLGGQSRRVIRIHEHETHDVIALVLSDGFYINGSKTGYSRSIYPGSNASLHGDTVVCAGWGYNSNNSTGGGVFRQALLEVNDNWNPIGFEVNSLGQGIAPGDSGGACYTVKYVYPYPIHLPDEIISVNTDTNKWPDPDVGYGPGPDQLYDFVEDVLDEEAFNFIRVGSIRPLSR